MVESTGLENRRCESIRGFESHSLRQLHIFSYLRKYPSGRRGSPAKGVGRQKRREGSNPSFRAKSRNRGTTMVPRFFLYPCGFAGFISATGHIPLDACICSSGTRITHEITDDIRKPCPSRARLPVLFYSAEDHWIEMDEFFGSFLAALGTLICRMPLSNFALIWSGSTSSPT